MTDTAKSPSTFTSAASAAPRRSPVATIVKHASAYGPAISGVVQMQKAFGREQINEYDADTAELNLAGLRA